MDDRLRPLISALTLGEGFQLLLLIVASPEEADAALGAVQRAVRDETGGVPLFARLGVSGKATIELLEQRVLGPLANVGGTVVALDATSASAEDLPAWEELFRRINARRNAVVEAVGRPLVLCLSPLVEPVLGREAPDLWSIRGVRVSLVKVRASRKDAEFPLEAAMAAGLPDVLARLFPDRERAFTFLADVDYPASKLPLSDAPDFWGVVLRAADDGAVAGGVETVVRALDAMDDPGLPALRALLPARQVVSTRWVHPKELPPDCYVEPPWAAELAERMWALKEGDCLVVRAEVGAGFWSVATRIADQMRDRVVVRSRSNTNPAADFLAQLAPAVEAPALRRLFEALGQERRPAAEDLRQLPQLEQALAQRPFDSPRFYDQEEALAEAAHRKLLPTVLGLWAVSPLWSRNVQSTRSLRSCSHATIRLIPGWPAPAGSQDFVVPPASPDFLIELLQRRLRRADVRVRLAFATPAMGRFLRVLAGHAGQPGAFLLWLRILLIGGLPLTSERLDASVLSPDLADDGGPAAIELAARIDTDEVASEAVAPWVEHIPALTHHGLLTRLPEDRVRLAPLAHILRPAVLANLRAALEG